MATVLKSSPEPIPPKNIWNFDEMGTKAAYVSTFLYGLRGSRLNQGEKTGVQGEHVTMRAFVNVAGDFLEPIFLFCGAESSQPNILCKLLAAAGFENPCVLMKKGKATNCLLLFWNGLQENLQEKVILANTYCSLTAMIHTSGQDHYKWRWLKL